jgi:hypothetical protein
MRHMGSGTISERTEKLTSASRCPNSRVGSFPMMATRCCQLETVCPLRSNSKVAAIYVGRQCTSLRGKRDLGPKRYACLSVLRLWRRSAKGSIDDLRLDDGMSHKVLGTTKKPDYMSFLIATVSIAVTLTMLLCWKPTPKNPRTPPRCEGFSLCAG